MFVLLCTVLLFCAEQKGNPEVLEVAKSWLRSLADPQEDSPEAFAWFYPVAHPRFNAILHFAYAENVGEHLDGMKKPSKLLCICLKICSL